MSKNKPVRKNAVTKASYIWELHAPGYGLLNNIGRASGNCGMFFPLFCYKFSNIFYIPVSS